MIYGENMQIGIVILNYIKYEETINCVNSILSQQGISLEVVVVDNGSPNSSYKFISEQFKNNNNVFILRSSINLGYANGNNLGIDFLRSKGHSFIMIANSDTLFASPLIISQMILEYKDQIGLINPIVRNLNGSLDQRVQYKRNLIILRMIKAILKSQINQYKIVKNESVTEFVQNELPTGVQDKYYVVVGSVFMLTPDFFKNYKHLFDRTFLYFEECGTILLLHKAKLKCVIANTDAVIHKGGASTPNQLRDTSLEKKKMIAKSAKQVSRLIFMSQKKISKNME